MRDYLTLKSMIELHFCFEDQPNIKIKSEFLHFADTGRSDLPGMVGGGITDLVMNTLGYVWRDNFEDHTHPHDPHPDYIYGGGAAEGLGIVVAEAHGSFAKSVDQDYITGKAIKKYGHQVRPRVGHSVDQLQVLHGYSVAFGSNPNAAGAFLHVAETDHPNRHQPTDDESNVPASLAIATHGANLSLLGADLIREWTDFLQGKENLRPDPDDSVEFSVFEMDGKKIAVVHSNYFAVRITSQPAKIVRSPGFAPPITLCRRVLAQIGGPGYFALEWQALEGFLEYLQPLVQRDAPYIDEDRFRLPTFAPVGFGEKNRDKRDEDVPQYAMFRDGLIYGRWPVKEEIARWKWSAAKGLKHVG